MLMTMVIRKNLKNASMMYLLQQKVIFYNYLSDIRMCLIVDNDQDRIISKFESLVYYFNQFHICLIDNRQNSDLVVHYFKNKILPDVPTVYIILTNEGFKPLYVVNKQKPEEKYKTMIHDEVKHLLQNFIHRTLKCNHSSELNFFANLIIFR